MALLHFFVRARLVCIYVLTPSISEEKEVYYHSSEDSPVEENLGKSPQQKIESYNDRITLLSGSPMDFQSMHNVPSNLSAEQKQLIVDMLDVDPQTTLTNLALSLRFNRQVVTISINIAPC